MQPIDSIEEVVTRYLDMKNEEVDFSILINGIWGCGKTFYWKNVISPLVVEKGLQPVYVSLYGISNTSEIDMKIFVETIPILKSKSAKRLGESKSMEIAKLVAGIGADKFGINLSNVKMDFRKFARLKTIVLCFDDLERAEMNICSILGYINSFVEHDGIKTIIIGNEEEIKRKQEENKIDGLCNKQNQYSVIKEKLVGKTVDFPPKDIDYGKVIHEIIKLYEDGYKDFLLKQLSTVLDVFEKSETKNLRILKHALTNFRFVYDIISKPGDDKIYNYLVKLFRSSLSWSFEFESGKIDNELDWLNSISSELEFHFRSHRDPDEKTYLDRYCARYYPDRNTLFFSPMMFEYITTSHLNREKIKEETELNVMEKPERQLTPFQRLMGDYRNLDNNEFITLSKDVYDDLIRGKHPLRDYITAVQRYYDFATESLIDLSSEEVIAGLKKGAALAAEIDPKHDYYTDFAYAPRGSVPTDIKEFIIFLESLNEKNKALKQNESIQKLWELLDKDFSQFCEQLYDRDKEYSYLPVFQKALIDRLMNKISELNNEGLVSFQNSIAGRYALLNIEKDYVGDLEGLEYLNALLTEEKRKEDGKMPITMRSHNLAMLTKTIEDICKRLQGI